MTSHHLFLGKAMARSKGGSRAAKRSRKSSRQSRGESPTEPENDFEEEETKRVSFESGMYSILGRFHEENEDQAVTLDEFESVIIICIRHPLSPLRLS